MKIYVAGPMFSAGGNFNFPLFDEVAQKLRVAGFEVFNPCDLARETIGPLEVIQKLDKKILREHGRVALKQELAWICEHADLLLLLPGWQRSPGATAEHALARALEIEIRELDVIVPGFELEMLDVISE